LLYIAERMASLNRSDDNDLLAALRHPLRREILRLMESEDAISPRQLSTLLEQPLSNVSYHVRVLADCEAVALVNTVPVRGSMQHFYRNAVDAPWARQILGLGDAEGGTGGESRDD
jgi:DNA-binding transcriptional ArsR family regulator